MASVRFGIVHPPSISGRSSNPEYLPVSPGFLNATTPFYETPAASIPLGFEESTAKVNTRSGEVQPTTCGICFPELGQSDGQRLRSPKHVLSTDHDCPLARDNTHNSSWVKASTQTFDRGVFESIPLKKTSNDRPCSALHQYPQSSDSITSELSFLNNESHFPLLSQSAMISNKKQNKQANGFKKSTSVQCGIPLGVIKEDEVTALQSSNSDSNSKSNPVFPYDINLLPGGGQQDLDSLAPYQIHAIKFLMKTAPQLFSVGIHSVRQLLDDWDSAK